MKKFCLLCCVTLSGLLMLPNSGVAEDLMPPAWRGQPNTTLAQWTFSSSSSWVTPEVYSNPHGTPGGAIGPGSNWLPLWGGREGVWSFASADISIPPVEPKQYRFQFTWAAKTPGGHPEVALSAPANLVSEIQLGATGEGAPFGEVWMHTTLEFQPLPGSEWPWFTVWGDVMLDEMIIDTIVPEPGVWTLWLLACLACSRRRSYRAC